MTGFGAQRKLSCEVACFRSCPFCDIRRPLVCRRRHSKASPPRRSAETEAQIEEYWQLGCKVLYLPGNDVSTYLDGMKARAGRAHARLKSIGCRPHERIWWLPDHAYHHAATLLPCSHEHAHRRTSMTKYLRTMIRVSSLEEHL